MNKIRINLKNGLHVYVFFDDGLLDNILDANLEIILYYVLADDNHVQIHLVIPVLVLFNVFYLSKFCKILSRKNFFSREK